MEQGQALDLLDQMLWNAVLLAMPVLLATLVVGLIISIFQVATQIQEMTLSYVPKILTAAFLLIALGPWMLGRLTDWARALYLSIPTLGH
ncbi:flagellar biosynthetic protein FliQ [Sphingopyxis panaciterrae]|uniref:flagellar biosynthesis protein FliQ n=1 Tax=Sphingopyxis panaciterrae TaxID=363841 RepID=UPI0014209455|nr:flagellar biosynthetic protein FliQ [Sphingopyxis panaciterrae]